MIEPELLIKAYATGIFPMGMDDGEISWFSPDPRGIIPLDTFHVPHGLKRTLKKAPYQVRFNTAFEATMRACADRQSTWINDDIVRSYCELHEMGCAHSVESWENEVLVGGLYGVSLGGAFFGESMFTRATDASKVALVHLVERLNEREFQLLDTQWSTQHLIQFGCMDLPREEYLERLAAAIRVEAEFD